jgi:hypothetical protein
MSTNAVHLFKSMKTRVTRDVAGNFEAARRWSGMIQREVLLNDAWAARMGSIQLSEVGVVPIPGPTVEGLEFLDVAGLFVRELESGGGVGRRGSESDLARRASLPMDPPIPKARASFSEGVRMSVDKVRGFVKKKGGGWRKLFKK